jgi:predicted TIM-barrel fold metal-dependent hydrolase
MADKLIHPQNLHGKIIDIHTHSGINVAAFIKGEYPYCQSVEGLRYRQKLCGVDFTVTFPSSSQGYFDLHRLVADGVAVPAERPFSPVPYQLENRLLFTEIYGHCKDSSDRLMPFVMIDPGREVAAQIKALEELESEYPIYGIKVAPVQCQIPVTALLEEGRELMAFAAERDLPMLFHVTVHAEEQYSQASDTFRVIERYPMIRYCLAHCIGFDRELLERAGDMSNVWVDTSALKIQVQATHENQEFMAPPGERFDWDYSDHRSVMRSLVERFPETIVWGSDSPAYTYISRRLQGEGTYFEFRLQGTYEDEKAALDALPEDLKNRAGTENAIDFLFGK